MNYPETRPLIYDYLSGEIIDPITGEVVGRIHDYSPQRIKTEGGYRWEKMYPIRDDTLFLSRGSYLTMNEIVDAYYHIMKIFKIPGVSEYLLTMTLRMLIKKIGIVKHTKEFKVALLYIVLEQLGVFVDDVELASVFKISSKKLGSEIFRLKRKLKISYVSSKERAEGLIRFFGLRLSAGKDAILDAIKTLRSKPYPNRYTPRLIALSLLYLFMKKHNVSIDGKPLNLKYFTRKINAPTLPRVIRFVRKYYGI